jgi:hypothetical protein
VPLGSGEFVKSFEEPAAVFVGHLGDEVESSADPVLAASMLLGAGAAAAILRRSRG